jgi:hypothetical protein
VTLATLTIVVDVRVPDLDVVADAVGGVLVLIGALRIHGHQADGPGSCGATSGIHGVIVCPGGIWHPACLGGVSDTARYR